MDQLPNNGLVGQAKHLRALGNRGVYEYATIAHILPDALSPEARLITAASDTSKCVDFVCAYAQNVFKPEELSKPKVRAKAIRLMEAVAPVLSDKRIKPPVLADGYPQHLLKQVSDKADSAHTAATAVLTSITLFVANEGDRARATKDQEILDRCLIDGVKRYLDLYELRERRQGIRKHPDGLMNALEAYLVLEALSKTVLMRQEAQETMWRLGFATLKQAHMGVAVSAAASFESTLLFIDRAFTCPDFSGPFYAPFTCVEAARYLDVISLARGHLDGMTSQASGAASPAVFSGPSSPMSPTSPRSFRAKFRRFSSSSRPADEPTIPFKGELETLKENAKPYLDLTAKYTHHTEASPAQIRYYRHLTDDLRAKMHTLSKRTSTIDPVALGQAQVVVMQLGYGHEHFSELFQNEVADNTAVALPAEQLNRSSTFPTAAAHSGATRDGRHKRRKTKDCVMMSLGAEHRHRLAPHAERSIEW